MSLADHNSLLAIMLGKLRYSIQECFDALKEMGRGILDEHWLGYSGNTHPMKSRSRYLLTKALRDLVSRSARNNGAAKYFYDPKASCRT